MQRRKNRRIRLRLPLLLATLAVMAGAVWSCREPLLEFWVDDTRYAAEIAAAARKHGLDPQLVRAVVFQESRFNPASRGGKGEIGLMQILPRGAVADYANYHRIPVPSETRLFAPELNLEIGCWYLGRAMRRWREYRECAMLALVQYNAGESRADRWKPEQLDGPVLERIAIPSTRTYVEKIMNRYARYRAQESHAQKD